jgi:hypothetical protein
MDGLCIFTPTIDLEGYFVFHFDADPAMTYGLNSSFI